jgi:tRNA(His) 5'-end guanylyltransferase
MKRYELASQQYLTRRTPVVVRLDGKAFHTFTRGLAKPFDETMQIVMQSTMARLCKDIEGCVFGYTQSDEITLVLIDYKELDSEAYFDYRVDKLCSVIASTCTYWFNRFWGIYQKDEKIRNRPAIFDCRVFNVPKEDVCNAILWRQRDAEKNSILGLAQAHFSQKEMNGINCTKLQDKLFTERGVNWNGLPVCQKRGTACIKIVKVDWSKDDQVPEADWVIDENMPILSKNREYVNDAILYFEEDDT